MLPPPTTVFSRSAARTEFSVRTWSGEDIDPGTGVIESVPVSWAYEYKMSSALDCGNVDENAERVCAMEFGFPPLGGWPSPSCDGRRPERGGG